MPERDTPQSKPSAQRHGQTIPDNDSLATDDRGTRPHRSSVGNRPLDTQSEHPDSVEIGEPVREKDRTTRASDETGEDEDLPDPSVTVPDNGGTETDRGSVVRSPRNFDD